MEVADGGQKLRQGPKTLVDHHLLQVDLPQPAGIGLICPYRVAQHLSTRTIRHDFRHHFGQVLLRVVADL